MKRKFLSCFFLATFLWSQTALSMEKLQEKGKQQKFASVVYKGANCILVSDGNESVPEDYYYIKKNCAERFFDAVKKTVTHKKFLCGLLCGTVIVASILLPVFFVLGPFLKENNLSTSVLNSSTTISPNNHFDHTFSPWSNDDFSDPSFQEKGYLDFRYPRECKNQYGYQFRRQICVDYWAYSNDIWNPEETPVTYLGANCIFNQEKCPPFGSFAGGADVKCYRGICDETLPNTVDQRTGKQVSHNLIIENRQISYGAIPLLYYSQINPYYNFFNLNNPHHPSHWMPYGIKGIIDATQHMNQIVAYQPTSEVVNTDLIPVFYVYASNLQLGPEAGAERLGFRNNEKTYFEWASRIRVSQEKIDSGSILHEMLHCFLNGESYNHFGFLKQDFSLRRYFSGPQANAIAQTLGINKVYLAENYHHLANGMGAGIRATSGSAYDEIYLKIGVLTQAVLEDLGLIFQRSNSFTNL